MVNGALEMLINDSNFLLDQSVSYVLKPTFGFCCLVIGLANKFPILYQVELVASVELPRAHRTHKALQMVDIVLGPSHHLSGWNS